MIYKKLGNTQIEIPAIGQGTALNTSSDAIGLGIKLGMSLIDTAEVYGTEEVVAQAIKGIRDKVFICTKFSPEHNSYEDVIRAAEGSLRRLQTDYIDLYQVHWSNPRIPLWETMDALVFLTRQSKIRHIGVCNFSLKNLKEARVVLANLRTFKNITSIQVEYNLFDRSIEADLLPYCGANQITTIAYAPLERGRIGSGAAKMMKLQTIADKYDKSLAQITLNWLICHPGVVAIPKASTGHHVRENAAAADFTLSTEDFKEIGEIFSYQVAYIPVKKIRPQVYKTIEEAIENKLGYVPGPKEIADRELLKPVTVVKRADGHYKLDGGQMRYWAWIIKYGWSKPIPALIREIA